MAVGDLSTVEHAIAELRRVAQGDDLAAIKQATEALQKASHVIAEALYKAQGSQGSQDSAGSQGSAGSHSSNVKDGEVVDAEYAGTV